MANRRGSGTGRPSTRTASAVLGLQSPRSVDLCWAANLMQESAVVLVPPADRTASTTGSYRVRYANHPAAGALGIDPGVAAGRHVNTLLPQDTARMLTAVCDDVLRSGRPAEHVAIAPDPLTDLTGTPSIVLRVTRVGDALLCTWVPGWQVRGEVAAMSVADRLALGATVDELADSGFGAFLFDLASGRFVRSRGMHVIFGCAPGTGVADSVHLGMLTETDPASARAWRALIRRSVPMDVEVRLPPTLGGRRVRIVARTGLGPDSRPLVVRGWCCTQRD